MYYGRVKDTRCICHQETRASRATTHAGTSLKMARKQFGWPACQMEHARYTTKHPMAASVSHSTSPLTWRKRTMKPSASYEFRRTLSSSSLEAARCAGIGVASSLVVLELSATSREARPPLAEDGRVADEGVGSPLRMDTWRARALAARCGATSKGVGSLMRRDERGRWQPHEVPRASTGRRPRSECSKCRPPRRR